MKKQPWGRHTVSNKDDDTQCQVCGKPHEGPEWEVRDKRCNGVKRDHSGLCGRPAGWGTGHPGIGRCKLHGGSTQSHQQAAEREMAKDAVRRFALPRDVDPFDALMEEIARTAGVIDLLEEELATLEREQLVRGFSEVTRTQTAGGDAGIEQRVKQRSAPSVWMQLYQRERKHYVEVCRVAIATGIAERQVRLAEQQGRIIVEVIRSTLQDLGIEETGEVRQAVGRHLRAVPDNRAS